MPFEDTKFCCVPESPRSIATQSFVETYERMLIIAWLLKDFGWMLTDVYVALPFGVVSVCLHFMLLFFEPRRSFRWYDFSLLCWVSGNFLWMCTEFMYSHNNREVHFGPDTPLGSWPPEWEDRLTNVKVALFVTGSVVQLVMYLLIWTRRIEMPQDYGEDIVTLNEVQLLCGHGGPEYQNNGLALLSLHDNIEADGSKENLGFFEDPGGGRSPYTIAYVENVYILFWVLKDLFWCWGTGDLLGVEPSEALIVLCEALAISFGAVAILNNVLTAYIWRRDSILMLDCLSAVAWIVANFTWMCGEFFVRYDGLELADDDQGDDYKTRVAASVFFSFGLLIQFGNVATLIRRRCYGAQEARRPVGLYATSLEMTAFAPLSSRQTLQQLEAEHEEGLMIF